MPFVCEDHHSNWWMLRDFSTHRRLSSKHFSPSASIFLGKKVRLYFLDTEVPNPSSFQNWAKQQKLHIPGMDVATTPVENLTLADFLRVGSFYMACPPETPVPEKPRSKSMWVSQSAIDTIVQQFRISKTGVCCGKENGFFLRTIPEAVFNINANRWDRFCNLNQQEDKVSMSCVPAGCRLYKQLRSEFATLVNDDWYQLRPDSNRKYFLIFNVGPNHWVFLHLKCTHTIKDSVKQIKATIYDPAEHISKEYWNKPRFESFIQNLGLHLAFMEEDLLGQSSRGWTEKRVSRDEQFKRECSIKAKVEITSGQRFFQQLKHDTHSCGILSLTNFMMAADALRSRSDMATIYRRLSARKHGHPSAIAKRLAWDMIDGIRRNHLTIYN